MTKPHVPAPTGELLCGKNDGTSLYAALQAAHYQETLPELIGKALGKKAVMLILIDVRGAITTVGNSEDDSTRDRSMIRQITELLAKNMDAMMKKAGAEAREGD